LAKNLKLNIKNTQLAEALKLGKVKKPAAPKKAKEEKKIEAPSEEAAKVSTPKEKAPEKVEKKEAPAPIEKAPEAPIEKAPEKAAEAPKPADPEKKKEFTTPSYQREERPPYQPREGDRERPAYQPREGGYNRPSYPQREGDRPPYQPRDGAARPPYQPRDGASRPPYQPRDGAARPPYQPRDGAARPPYQPRDGAARPPYQPRDGAARPPYSRPPYNQGAPGTQGPRREYPPSPRYEGPRKDFNQPFKQAIPPKIPDEPSKKFRPAGADVDKKKVTGFKDFKDIKPQRKEAGKTGFDSRDRQGLRDSNDEEWRRKRHAKGKMQMAEEAVVRPKTLKVRVPITVKDLAVEMKLKASQLISKLFMQGVVITLNDYLDDETTIQLLGTEFDCEITIDRTEEERIRITEKSIKEEVQEAPPEDLIIRPPVVAFMGHVDHGKTSLIDYIRKANVAAGEAGAITQHIGAFKCHTAVGDITILDTPGHEAFSAMRSRGADVTDIVVLVVAGDEGIKAQTEEAIKQAKEANVPIVVALNKCDKPGFNAENVYRELAEKELLPESWGGTTITVNCSAVTGVGIKELLEMLALQAEVLELRANPKARARGTVIESQMHKGLGPVATVLVQNGSLRLGDALVFAMHWARVKTMHDAAGNEIEVAGPSTPVKITGLSGLPDAGNEFIAVKSENVAKELAYQRTEGEKRVKLQQAKPAGLEGLLQQKRDSSEQKILTLILRADVQGSVEALKTSLLKIASKKVILNIISASVGEISESDAELAAASKATIIGFHTKVAKHAEGLIKAHKVQVKIHNIIYHAVDDVREQMRLLLDKIPQENDAGSALVKAVFKSSQIGLIAGCQVIDGIIKRNNHVRLIRDGKVIWKGAISSLKRGKEDVREVSKGIECGILIQNNDEVKEGDIIQAFDVTYLEQDL